MILLELTLKEAEMISEIVGLEKNNVLEHEIGFSEKERKAGICNSVLAKLELAHKPKEDLLITSKDLFHIKCLAKGEYQHLSGNLQISRKRVEEEDFVHISLANALVMWLNQKGLLKKLAKFDYTDSSNEYEESEE